MEAGLQRNEVDKVTLWWGHVIREEVDQRVEELGALSIGLIHIGKTSRV